MKNLFHTGTLLFLLLCHYAGLNMSTVKAQAQGEFVPEWAKHVVWYQIFPERFRNGDPANDPNAASLAGADPQDLPKQWQVHPWGSDWYKLQPYELANGKQPLWKHLLRRRYGGDLQGIIDKLGYLQELGITAIYLNPVFCSPSLHKYDGASYHHIDPHFGPDPVGDQALIDAEDPLDYKRWVWTKADELALTLIREAHRRGIRIIFDGVFNHMGINSFAFKDLAEKQQRSRFRDWFTVTSWNDPALGTSFAYEGWWGVNSLPEFREDENGIVSGPKEYIFAATERWMNPKGLGASNGIDGWRLDVAFCVKHAFWKDWRKHVKQLNPEAYLTAELVLPQQEVAPYLAGDEFDGEMNYNFAMACAEFFFNPEGTRISAEAFDRKLEQLRNLYPAGVAYVVQNLFGSHDSNRLASHIVNRGIGEFRDWGEYFALSKAADNPKYQVRKPNTYERELQRLFVLFQMTYVGAPMIYYGDEVGMWGANDPDCRKPMLWDDIAFEDETVNPDGGIRTPDAVTPDHGLRNYYAALIKIRNTNPALRTGTFTTVAAKGTTYAFKRSQGENEVLIVINTADSGCTVELTGVSGNWVNLLTGETAAARGDKLFLEVKAKTGYILSRN